MIYIYNMYIYIYIYIYIHVVRTIMINDNVLRSLQLFLCVDFISPSPRTDSWKALLATNLAT